MKNLIFALVTMMPALVFAAGNPFPKIESGIYESPASIDVCIVQVLQSADRKTISISVNSSPTAPNAQRCGFYGHDIGNGWSQTFTSVADQSQCGKYPCYIDNNNEAIWVFDTRVICLDGECSGQSPMLSKK